MQAFFGMFVFVLLFFPCLTLKVEAKLHRAMCVSVCACVSDCVRQRQKEHMAAAAKAVN